MICVSIARKAATEVAKAAAGLKLAEIRINALASPKREDVEKIFRAGNGAKLIATCRPGALTDEKRKGLLLAAIASGAAYVDVEVDAPEAYKKEIASAAKKAGCKLIVSFHDHNRTPPREELSQIAGWCFESGADICKIACKANSREDAARLLGLLGSGRKIAVVGMGKQGRITRIAAPLLGSPFTYASEGEGKETAEGQIGREKLGKILEAIKNA